MACKTKDKYRLHLRLSPWVYNGVDYVSTKYGMTVSDVVRIALTDYIKKEVPKTDQDHLVDDLTVDI